MAKKKSKYISYKLIFNLYILISLNIKSLTIKSTKSFVNQIS